MSQAVITKAFTQWKAQQAVDNKAVTLDEFIFANVPGLDVTKPISNTEGIPAADKIVYRQTVGKTGVVNTNAVVYSVTLGADVGDFDFNWIGLINKASGTLAMIIHAPTQRKVKNASGQQGNVLVRSMLMEYSGAQTATSITTPAETWQIDFTARLAGMDEADRLNALDIYGAGAFFDNGFLVAKTGTQYFVTKGLGYIGGLRAALAANQNISVSTKPTKVWVDVSYQGTLTSAFKTDIKFTVAATLADYTTNGIAHYVFALASIDANGVITDLRPKGSSQYLRRDKNLTDISDPVVALDTLNGVPKTRKINKKALSSDFDLTASDVGALAPGDFGVGGYGKSVQDANAIDANGFYLLPKGAANAPVAGMHAEVIHAGYDNNSAKQIAWRAGGSSVSRMYHRAKSGGTWGGFVGVYDESNKPTPADVGALPADGTATAANKLATARKIAGVAFDGTKDINITAANIGAVQQGGGTGMSSNTIRIGWSGKKLLAQVDSIQMGELYYTNNPPSAAAVGALPTDGTAVAATKLAAPRKIAGVEFDGTKDISISAGNVGALPSGGTAVAASKLATARKIAGVTFDGTKDISLSAENVNAIQRDVCSVAGFVSGNKSDPYMRHSTSNEVVQLARRDWVGDNFATTTLLSNTDAATRNWANRDLRNDIYAYGDNRYVYDVQRGSQALENASFTAQADWEAPTGCFMTGIKNRVDLGDARTMGKYYRALMVRTASGGWRQVGN